MDCKNDPALSCFEDAAVINEEHQIYMVRDRQTGKVYVRKILDVFNPEVYRTLLSHPVRGIPRVYEFVEDALNSQAVLIEEYIPGRTLEELIEAGSLTQPQAGRIICGLCDILTCLHTMNPPIIHRDIKPSNIMLTDTGQTVLIDLNAARVYHPDEDGNREQDTVLLGTHGYAAPEQYGFGTSTPRTDIYALGIVIREMEESLSGSPEEFPLKCVVEKCTRLRPLDRYASAAEVKAAVEAAMRTGAAAAGTAAGTVLRMNDYTAADAGTDIRQNRYAGTGSETADTSYSYGHKSYGNRRQHRVNREQPKGDNGSRDGRQYRKFLPPGFRSGNPLAMLLAGAGYVYLGYLCFGRIPDYYNVGQIAGYYVFPFLAILLTVSVWADYLGIRKLAPFQKHANRLIRLLGVLILNAVIIFMLMVVTDIIYQRFS